jgi:hypothetical protein
MSVKKKRLLVLAGGALAVSLSVYIATYISLRRSHRFVHYRFESPVRHSIELGESGPFLFAAASFTDNLGQLEAIAQNHLQKEQRLFRLFWPARKTEIVLWYLIDSKPSPNPY